MANIFLIGVIAFAKQLEVEKKLYGNWYLFSMHVTKC